MSLIYCPECGHEISTAAVACPSCGRPINIKPASVPRVVEPAVRRTSVPPWVIAPVVLLGALVLFGIIYLFTASDDADNTRVAVNASRRPANSSSSVDRNETTIAGSPGTDSPSTSVPAATVPESSYPSVSDTAPSTTTIPGTGVTAPQNNRATVMINARIATRNGTPQPVRNTRFYLLDKDVETILEDADLEPLEGQSSLATSLAVAAADQARYGQFYREAMSALKEHIKYTGSTDGSGKAQLGSVEPDSYYLFGVARAGNGFALWNSPVSVISGENLMNLAPQPVTEMPATTGEE